MQHLGSTPMNHEKGRSPGKDGRHYRQWRNYVQLLPPAQWAAVTTARRAMGRFAAELNTARSLSCRDACQRLRVCLSVCLSLSNNSKPSERISTKLDTAGTHWTLKSTRSLLPSRLAYCPTDQCTSTKLYGVTSWKIVFVVTFEQTTESNLLCWIRGYCEEHNSILSCNAA
jgi:hypothetical protein